MTRLFFSFLATAAMAWAQTNYSVVLIDPQLPLGNYTAAGFPVTGIPFVSPSNILPSPVQVPLPTGWVNLAIQGVCNGMEVGNVSGRIALGGAGGGSQFETPSHVASWSAPFYEFNYLHNSMVTSTAAACNGNVVVGAASNGFNSSHAMMWTADSPKSQIDLHSSPYQSTALNSISGNTQAGWGTLNRIVVNGVEISRFTTHALVWHGAVKSLTDLHPAGGYLDSFATQFGPAKEAGYVTQQDPVSGELLKNAMVWSGTAASAVNLHQFLPFGWSESQAYFLDVPTGVISGTADNGPGSAMTIVLWVPIQ